MEEYLYFFNPFLKSKPKVAYRYKFISLDVSKTEKNDFHEIAPSKTVALMGLTLLTFELTIPVLVPSYSVYICMYFRKWALTLATTVSYTSNYIQLETIFVSFHDVVDKLLSIIQLFCLSVILHNL